ncbi:MAG: cation transporter dimerization domain-containing protein, partial [Thermodesulfobacteriota bacterium]|nr:cation transporter dimerization domain-containing protein [Thermodesulfobacteriota bacterium]
ILINVHEVKVRTSGGQYQMEIHIVVNGDLTVTQGNRIATQVETCLLADIANTDRVIVHVDPDESGQSDPP